MQNKTLFAFLLVLALASGLALLPAGCGKSSTDQHSQVAAAKYHCPMHPTVVSDKPGDCPICFMKLVPIEENKQEAASQTGKSPPGLAAVTIPQEKRERINMKFGTVEKRELSRQIRTSARIVTDETRLFRVTTKIGGWVDKLHVAVTGQAVNKGDPLLSIYSPELVASEQEYLSALKAFKDMPANTAVVVKQGARSVLDATKRRLQLWDISDEQITRIEKSGEVEKTLILAAPSGGVVIEKSVMAGQKIMPGDSLLVVADLTNVWADADIYESDLPYIKVGMSAEVSLPFWQGKTFKGEVIFVSPTVDPETRSLKARLNLGNTNLLLKPGMYADAGISCRLGERIVVPETAVMRTGERDYAFRDDGEGRLTPVDIKVGTLSGGYYEVVSGLKEGDRVVTSANFLVDSESSMKAAIEGIGRGEKKE